MTTLQGRRVLVTGAAGALGNATVVDLRGLGAVVVGMDVVPGDADLVACDVRDADSVKNAVVTALDRLGGLDAVIHFAGVGLPTSAGESPGEAALSTLDINLVGPWRVTAACIDALVTSRGRVVFVASQLAYATIPFATAYTVSKRGLTAYADSVRMEYGSHVGVTTVYPGYVRTPIHAPSVAAGLALETAVRSQRAEDVVSAVRSALTARRSPRDLACTPSGRFELAACRHIPRVADAVIAARLRREVLRGRLADAPLAAAMRERMGAVRPPVAEGRVSAGR